jgi:hypothetical protein
MNTRAELGTLEASGLVQVATLDPELEYLFRHALVQDAAYSSLLKQDRRALHRLAADTLLSLYPERQRELAAVIAMHLEQAGDGSRAAEHLVVAGEHALERFANREAIAFFDRALAYAPRSGKARSGGASPARTDISPTWRASSMRQAIAPTPGSWQMPISGSRSSAAGAGSCPAQVLR